MNEHLKNRLGGAFDIICARLFYREDGSVSPVKVSVLLGFVGLALFTNGGTILSILLVLSFFVFAGYVLLPVFKPLVGVSQQNKRV